MKKIRTYSMTALIVIGILIIYIHQMSPSPILSVIRDEFKLGNNNVLLNMSISITCPMLIIGSIVGSTLEQKIGTSNLFVLTILFAATGLLFNFIAVNYVLFLIGRIIYGIGFGLSISFIGSAIMKWYSDEQRTAMTTINALFPFFGTVICFMCMGPEYKLLNNNLKFTFGIWGILLLAILLLWVVVVRNPDHYLSVGNEKSIDGNKEKVIEENIYLNLLHRKPIVLLSVIFACDFSCYSYIATILPTLLYETSNMGETVANLWAAVAFPAAGILGCSLGGVVTNKLRLRKPTIISGQLLKFIGIIISVFGSKYSVYFTIMGAGLFGFGNGFWMPAFYSVPTELPKMNSSLVSAAFALMTSCGFAMGFIVPTIGGWLTMVLMNVAPVAKTAHAFGLTWSLFIFGFLNLIAFACAIMIPETGQNAMNVKSS